MKSAGQLKTKIKDGRGGDNLPFEVSESSQTSMPCPHPQKQYKWKYLGVKVNSKKKDVHRLVMETHLKRKLA